MVNPHIYTQINKLLKSICSALTNQLQYEYLKIAAGYGIDVS